MRNLVALSEHPAADRSQYLLATNPLARRQGRRLRTSPQATIHATQIHSCFCGLPTYPNTRGRARPRVWAFRVRRRIVRFGDKRSRLLERDGFGSTAPDARGSATAPNRTIWREARRGRGAEPIGPLSAGPDTRPCPAPA